MPPCKAVLFQNRRGGMSRKNLVLLVCALLFAAMWCLLRLPWIAGDGGVPSAWEYGYFVTDEGYYLDGGKEKFLWGNFVDLVRIEAFTYGFSSLTHYLSYLAHLCFGLSTWTWRIPFVAINFTAWMALLIFIAKKRGAICSFLLCSAVSITPMIIEYERTASNDVLIGSLLALAYVIACIKGKWSLPAAAFMAALIVLVKPSVYLILPIVLAGGMSVEHFRSKKIDVAVFIISSALFLLGLKYLSALVVYGDAMRQGTGIWEIIKTTTTHYPLPSLADVSGLLKGVSNFPRDPSGTLLGFWSVALTVAPATVLALCLFRRMWSWRLLMYVSVGAYVGGIAVMNTTYTHYYIPMIMIFPLLWANVLDDVERNAIESADLFKFVLVGGIAVISGIVTFSIGMDMGANAVEVQKYYARIYNLSKSNVWAFTYPAMIAMVVGLMGASLLLGWKKSGARVLAVAAAGGGIAGSVCFAQLPAVVAAPLMKADKGLYATGMAICVAFSVFVVLSVALRLRLQKNQWCAIPLIVALVSYVAMPSWRTALGELTNKATYHHREAAKELKRLLPSNAVVVGERSNQMLMSLPIKTATTFPKNSDPIPIIEAVLKANADTPVFALVDSQHSYCMQHFRENSHRFQLRHVYKFRMPGFGTGRLVDVHLCRVLARQGIFGDQCAF